MSLSDSEDSEFEILFEKIIALDEKKKVEEDNSSVSEFDMVDHLEIKEAVDEKESSNPTVVEAQDDLPELPKKKIEKIGEEEKEKEVKNEDPEEEDEEDEEDEEEQEWGLDDEEPKTWLPPVKKFEMLETDESGPRKTTGTSFGYQPPAKSHWSMSDSGFKKPKVGDIWNYRSAFADISNIYDQELRLLKHCLRKLKTNFQNFESRQESPKTNFGYARRPGQPASEIQKHLIGQPQEKAEVNNWSGRPIRDERITYTSGFPKNTSGFAPNTSGFATNTSGFVTNTSGFATNTSGFATNTSGFPIQAISGTQRRFGNDQGKDFGKGVATSEFGRQSNRDASNNRFFKNSETFGEHDLQDGSKRTPRFGRQTSPKRDHCFGNKFYSDIFNSRRFAQSFDEAEENSAFPRERTGTFDCYDYDDRNGHLDYDDESRRWDYADRIRRSNYDDSYRRYRRSPSPDIPMNQFGHQGRQDESRGRRFASPPRRGTFGYREASPSRGHLAIPIAQKQELIRNLRRQAADDNEDLMVILPLRKLLNLLDSDN